MDKTAAIINRIYLILNERYGNLNWWPADSTYEVIAGAILTQNTAWTNVEKALRGFGGRLSPELVEGMATEKLAEIIRPAGFFNQKAVYLKEITCWYNQYDYSAERVKKEKPLKLRSELLSVKGIGCETADSILLYAFGFPSFVVDAYTKRLLTRIGIDVKKDYVSIKALFEDSLPKRADVYNNYHAMIVINAKQYCKAKPSCAGCPLEKECAERIATSSVLSYNK